MAFLLLLKNETPSFSTFSLQVPLFGLYQNTLLTKQFDCLAPSAQFCIESIVLNLTPNNIKETFLLNPDSIVFPTSRLFIPDDSNLNFIIKTINNNNIKNIKLKIGRMNLSKEIHIINEIINHTTCQLRLDGNQNLNFDQLIYIADNIDLTRIEYFEEPISNILDYDYPSTLNIALDETFIQLINSNKNMTHIPNNISTIVIKPNLIGALYKCFSLFDDLFKLNIDITLSSPYLGPVGINSLKPLLCHKNSKGHFLASGVDTLKYLNQDYLKGLHSVGKIK